MRPRRGARGASPGANRIGTSPSLLRVGFRGPERDKVECWALVQIGLGVAAARPHGQSAKSSASNVLDHPAAGCGLAVCEATATKGRRGEQDKAIGLATREGREKWWF